METIQIEVGKIKPNPFKKYINKGELDEEIVEKLVEGFKQTKFHENLVGRRNKEGEVELVYGHHRLEAVIRVYGKKHIITLKVYSMKEFPDESMLIDMIRENLTQRDDYKDMADSIILVKRWLENGSQLDARAGKKEKVKAPDIAKFISKQGKSINADLVSRYLRIEENLHPNLKNKITSKIKAGLREEGRIGFETAYNLAIFDKSEQEILSSRVEKATKNKVRHLLSHYRNSTKEVKEKVKSGKLDLEDVPVENLKSEIKANTEKMQKDSKLIVVHNEKFLREAGNLVGDLNTKILQTCAFLGGLESSGVLYELDWNKISQIINLADVRANQYVKFIEKIKEKYEK